VSDHWPSRRSRVLPSIPTWSSYCGGFGDVGSREQMGLGPEGVMVSLPGSELTRIVCNLREMRSKKAFGR